MRRARGAILLEVLLAFGIFVVAAFGLLAIARESSIRAARAHERAVALDLARSALALVEVGLATPESLEGEVVGGPVDPEREVRGAWVFRIGIEQDEGDLVLLRVDAQLDGVSMGGLSQVVSLRDGRLASGAATGGGP